MRSLTPLWLTVLLVLSTGHSLSAAETGDFDGDGRLTIGDVLRMIDTRVDPNVEPAAGSIEAFDEYPPSASLPGNFVKEIAGSVYLESLRRTLSGPFPTYSFMHWPDTWLEEIVQPPLPVDPRVTIRLLPVETAGDPDVRVTMELTTTEPLRAFSLALDSPGGMLRVPCVWIEQSRGTPNFKQNYWAVLDWMLMGVHDEGDLKARVSSAAYLMSGGRYVVAYGLRYSLISRDEVRRDDPELAPGSYRIITRGRLPRGTQAGTYPLHLLQGSQVLLADGTLVAPTSEGDSEIVVSNDIDTGWDEGLPPLRFDVQNQRVLGKVEFRFADAAGDPVPEGVPVAQGRPGDVVKFRVQVRTETPLNTLAFEFRWPEGLVCTFESTPLLEQAGEDLPEAPSSFSTCNHLAGLFQARFFLGGNWSQAGIPLDFTALYDRPLEYFKPLNEWIDLYEVIVQIPDEPPLDVIPLELLPRRAVRNIAQDWVRAEFAPYTANYYGKRLRVPEELWPDRDLWEYDIRFHNSFVLVEGGTPPSPPDHFIHFELEDVVVPPGGTVEVPVRAFSADPLSFLRLVVESDPESVMVEAANARALNPETGLTSRRLVSRGERARIRSPDCPDDPADPCWGVPAFVWFEETEPRFTYIDWIDLGIGGPYPGEHPVEIARLVVRAAENPRSTEVRISPAVLTIGDGPFAETYESGGIADKPLPVVPFSPAHEVVGATVRIGRNGFFRRGDVNHDGMLNITDGIVLLEHLFGGGPAPDCLDAADADDNGAVQLTDAVFLLLGLFGAGEPPPAPQVCGDDPTDDDVPCDRHVCQRE